MHCSSPTGSAGHSKKMQCQYIDRESAGAAGQASLHVPICLPFGCVTVQDKNAQSAFYLRYLRQGVTAQVSGRMRRAHMRQLSRLREPGSGERPMLLFPEVLTVPAALASSAILAEL